MSNRPHIPIMENEVASFFAGSDLRVYFDGTLGAGGHAKRILEEHPEIEVFIGCDQDPEALTLAKETLSPWKGKVELVHGNFAQLDQILKKRKIAEVDGFFLT